MLCAKATVTTRVPFEAGYRYFRDHDSLYISVTLPYFASSARILPSDTSGGRFAILMRLVPIPANPICTLDISPLSRRNSLCPFMARTVCTRSLSFIRVCAARLFVPCVHLVLAVVVAHKSIHGSGMLICTGLPGQKYIQSCSDVQSSLLFTPLGCPTSTLL